MRGCSLLPFILFGILALLFSGGGGQPALERGYAEGGSSPRRPSWGGRDEYVVGDMEPGRDSQGTVFAIPGDARWMTAQHVTQYCDRIGIIDGARRAIAVDRVVESRSSDAALIEGGLDNELTLAIASREPQPGEPGVHMGFPQGQPAIVLSELIGQATVRRGTRGEPTLAWAEVERIPEFDLPLSGISGGPTLDLDGRVVGVNSAGSERRGRVLTTRPDALTALAGATTGGFSAPIDSEAAAVTRFQQLIAGGAIRVAVCDVN